MKKHFRSILRAVLLLVFIISTLLVLRQWRDNAEGKTTYSDALAIAMQAKDTKIPAESHSAEAADAAAEPVSSWVPVPVEDDPVMEEMELINIDALREVNEDVVGWIRIPDTKIDYPLMQGEDNEFYLNHTWEKQPNSVGSIFLEYLSDPDLTDYNTVVYGHNMNDKAMFGELEHYALTDFWKAHPYVYIATDAGVYRYEIFSFSQPSVDSLTYGLNPQRDDTKEKFLNLSLESSWINTGIQPAITDRVLTLSTCSGADYAFRYVVQARLPMMEVTN